MREWLVNTMDALGYWGIAIVMFLEHLVPPIPSEVVMPAAGFAARQGRLSVWGCIAAGSAGSLAGAVFWYAVAWWVGVDRLRRWFDGYGKWIGLRAGDVDTAVAWFERWGAWAVLLGRMAPGVRTLISAPAGVARMRVAGFLVLSAIGTVGWTAALAGVGWALGDRHGLVAKYLQPAGVVVVAGLVGWLVWALVQRGRRTRREVAGEG